MPTSGVMHKPCLDSRWVGFFGLVWFGLDFGKDWFGLVWIMVWFGFRFGLVWIGLNYGLVWLEIWFGLDWISLRLVWIKYHPINRFGKI